MIDPEWDRTLNNVVDEILEKFGMLDVPVDTVRLASLMSIDILVDSELNGRAYREIDSDGCETIILAPCDREERVQFAVAHEIAESHFGLVCEYSEYSRECLESCRELICNQLATRIICPSKSFSKLAYQTDFDLHELKEVFTTASHEVIARRMLDFEIPTVITICDNSNHPRRISNFASAAKTHPIERSVWKTCRRTKGPTEEKNDEIRVQGWAIHESGWKREILRTSCRNWD